MQGFTLVAVEFFFASIYNLVLSQLAGEVITLNHIEAALLANLVLRLFGRRPCLFLPVYRAARRGTDRSVTAFKFGNCLQRHRRLANLGGNPVRKGIGGLLVYADGNH